MIAVLIGICSLVFSETSQTNKNLEQKKNDRKGFSIEILVCPDISKKGLR